MNSRTYDVGISTFLFAETLIALLTLSPPVNILLTVPMRYFFVDLLCFNFCLAFDMPLCASVYICLVVTGRQRADLLALVCGV